MPFPSIERKTDLEYCLRDFKYFGGIGQFDLYDKGKIITISDEGLPPSYIVFLMFVVFLEYKFWGKEEKVKWTIPLKYKDIPFFFSERKLGFRLLTFQEENLPESFVNEMLSQINKGIKIADHMLQPYFHSLLQKGHITLANSYIKLTGMYDYFRINAQKSFDKKLPKKRKSIDLKEGLEFIAERMNFRNEFDNRGFYYSAAMMDAFFSRLEHILVFALPFSELSLEKIDVSNFLKKRWMEKYKTIFDLENDNEALKHFQVLSEIKDKYRNPLNHGFFQKNNASIFVQIPTMGAVPLNLANWEGNLHFSISPIALDLFENISKAFDDFDYFLKSSKLKYAIKYAEAGFDISLDPVSIETLLKACKSDDDFDSYLEKMSYYYDMNANMDW